MPGPSKAPVTSGSESWLDPVADPASRPVTGLTAGNRITVLDDGDGNPADYEWTGLAWTKMADPDAAAADHLNLANIGTRTHAQIDTALDTLETINLTAGMVEDTLDLTASQTSDLNIPANGEVTVVYIRIDTPYDNAATLDVGHGGDATLLLSGFDLTQAAGTYLVDDLVTWDGTERAVVSAVSGAPTVGAATLVVVYQGAPAGESSGAVMDTLGISPTYTSTKQIAANAEVVSVHVRIDTAYDNAATLDVGHDGDTTLLGTGIDLTAVAGTIYLISDMTAWGGIAKQLRSTINGSPTVGAATVVVHHTKANTEGAASHTELADIGTKTHARIDTDLAALVMAADPRGKLPTVWVSATTARIPAGSIFFDPDTGSAITFAADRDAVITVSGVGGLDASDTETVSTWYYLQAVWADDGTYGAILSSSSGALGTQPPGFSNRAKLHAVYNDSGGDIDEFTAIPDGSRWRVSKEAVLLIDTITPATSPTGLVVSGVLVPDTAVAATPTVYGGLQAPQTVYFFPSASIGWGTSSWLHAEYHKYSATSSVSDVPINPDGKIYYSAVIGTNNTVRLWVGRWLE